MFGPVSVSGQDPLPLESNPKLFSSQQAMEVLQPGTVARITPSTTPGAENMKSFIMTGMWQLAAWHVNHAAILQKQQIQDQQWIYEEDYTNVTVTLI